MTSATIAVLMDTMEQHSPTSWQYRAAADLLDREGAWRPAVPLIRAIAQWEREHGTVACIQPSEYEAFCKGIARAAVLGSARAVENVKVPPFCFPNPDALPEFCSSAFIEPELRPGLLARLWKAVTA